MTKSLVTYILGVASEVLEDFKRLSPIAVKGLDRDHSRLALLAETRGLPAFTLDLPALGKHFDKCLAKGLYTKIDAPHSIAGSKSINSKTSIPRLFSGLMLQVFQLDGVLREDACVHAISALRQLYQLARKLEVPCDDSRTKASVREFYTIESKLPTPTLRWGSEDLEVGDGQLDMVSYRPDLDFGLFTGFTFGQTEASRSHLDVCQKVFDYITTTLGPLDLMQWKAKHGQGAVSDGQLGKFYKYDFPSWPHRLDAFFPKSEFAHANYLHWVESLAARDFDSKSDIPSVLLTVPKTQKGPRLIAKEPTCNQWAQQLLLDFFANRIESSWIGKSIHLRDQTFNQRLARSASVTGSHWTVDLSSASDRVTCRFVERAFRRNPFLLGCLNACRTHYLTQKLDKKSPQLIALKKFSTMGSACTFPVESLVFLGLAISSVIISRGWAVRSSIIKRTAGDVLVFGDDIVIPKDAGPTLVVLLNHFDFEVNPDKTFTDGKFRESCGMECFDGVDVTPSYIPKPPKERSPDSVVSQVATSNNFFLRGYWRTANYLMNRVQRNDIPIVAAESGAFGFKSFVGTKPRRLYWDSDLQKEYIRAPMLRAKVERVETECNGQLLQYFTEAPHPENFILWHVGYTGRPVLNLRTGRVFLDTLPRMGIGAQVRERVSLH
jgi:hypothetical protein